MVEYKINSDQIKQILTLVNNIKANHSAKNKIYLVLWSVLDQKLPELTIEMRKIDNGELNERCKDNF